MTLKSGAKTGRFSVVSFDTDGDELRDAPRETVPFRTFGACGMHPGPGDVAFLDQVQHAVHLAGLRCRRCTEQDS